MTPLHIGTRTGGEVVLAAAGVQAFADTLRGEVLRAGDAGYDEARTIWNAMIDRRPALIVRAAGAADVIRAVNFARDHDLRLAVRGGGHNVAGKAVNDGGLIIDLSRMRSVHVDPRHRIARVEPGALLADVDRETQAFGLAVPGGIVSHTGIAGLTLGGGFGWTSRKYGLTVDNLLAADVVTASGELLCASKTENPELFWGLRGGGGNFGVVTSFVFRLHEVGPEILAGLLVQPFEAAGEFLKRCRDFVRDAPDELTVWLVMRKAPPLPFLPPEVHGRMMIAAAFAYLDDPREGERLIRPLREFGAPWGELVARMPFVQWQGAFDALEGHGARNYWKSHTLGALSDGAIEPILAHAAKLPSPQSAVFLAHLDGAAGRVPAQETAYAHRAAPFILNIHARWEAAEEDEQAIAWARQLFEATRPYCTGGVYVNFVSDEGEQRVRDAYPAAVWERLVRLKDRYDPANLFRLNQNIPPSAAPPRMESNGHGARDLAVLKAEKTVQTKGEV